MAVPTTNVKFSDIWSEANGAYSSGILSLNTMSFFSYFTGPNGSNNQPDNNWGQGEGSGANRIYGTSAKTINISVGDFDGLTYFYDNTLFQVTLVVTNNLPPPSTPPDPPDLNDINVTVLLYDNSSTFQYLSGGGGATSNGGTFGPNAISNTNTPIIFKGYWEVIISGVNPMFPGCNADLSINGNSKFTGQAVAGGSGGTTFSYIAWGDEDVTSFGGYDGLYFDITVN